LEPLFPALAALAACVVETACFQHEVAHGLGALPAAGATRLDPVAVPLTG
jgi:hypothetical protein